MSRVPRCLRRVPAAAIVAVVVLMPLTTIAQSTSITITVDVTANRRPIDPNIYGVAHATTAQLNDLNTPLNRNGGNNTTRYNWQLNADNRGNDWYFESIADGSATAGERGDTFIANARAANAKAMLTIPTDRLGREGRRRVGRKLASFSIAKYGAQTGNDWQWFPDAGNGVRTNGQFVTGNDPNDANVPSNAAVPAGLGRSIWSAAGARTRPAACATTSSTTSRASGTRPIATSARPARRWTKSRTGWSTSRRRSKRSIRRRSSSDPRNGAGAATSSAATTSNTAARTGGARFPIATTTAAPTTCPGCSTQLRQSSAPTGQRLLDVFTVHYYPQGGEFSDDVSSAMQLRRNRSTRSLWDPTYVDETWINDRVQLIPRLKSWVNTYYPGTPIGITEYNWGAENHINGATTQADIFGIFGREGLDMAARWTTPAASTPTYKAMKMYRNYDGNKSTFGDTSVAAAAPNPDAVSAFAAVDPRTER